MENDTIPRMRTDAGVARELQAKASPRMEEVSPSKIRSKTELGLVLLVSAAILIPCFWQRHIQAGDLASHVYNAWLAQLVGEGKAPGVYAVWQAKNVLFDLMLLNLGKVFGFGVAEKITVSACVLVFFWGVFTLISVATRKRPWLLVPGLAMLAYSYVFYMGFMNYYLSLGLACWPGCTGCFGRACGAGRSGFLLWRQLELGWRCVGCWRGIRNFNPTGRTRHFLSGTEPTSFGCSARKPAMFLWP